MTQDDKYKPIPIREEALEMPKSYPGGYELQEPPVHITPRVGSATIAIAIAAFVGFVFVWEVATTLQEVYAWHWSAGLLLSGIGIWLLIVTARSVLDFRRDVGEINTIAQLRDEAERYTEERTFGKSRKNWRGQLESLYENKTHAPLLKRSLEVLPDYANDTEVVQHLEDTFLVDLDEKAKREIMTVSKEIAILVALSPLAVVDMLIATWRCLRMIDAIGEIYGLRPSLASRVHLGRQVIRLVAITGVTQISLGALAEAAPQSLLGVVFTNVAQGLGIGVFATRIGFHTMKLCRPVPFREDNEPAILKELADAVKERLKELADAVKERS